MPRSLKRFSVEHDVVLLDRWLSDPGVATWFVDAAAERAEAEKRPADQQAILAVDDRPVGYARWRTVDPAALVPLGLVDFPPGSGRPRRSARRSRGPR